MSDSVATPSLSAPRPRARVLGRFYLAMSVCIAAAAFIGFSRAFYLRPYFRTGSLTPLVHVHAFVFTGWIVLLIAQSVLIRTRRVAIHRRLGVAGVFLATFMIILGFEVAVTAARRDFALSGRTGPLSFLATPLGDLVVFGVLFTLGFLFRRKPEAHKRLMLMASIALLPPAFARFPFAMFHSALGSFGGDDVLVAACLVYDWTTSRRVHPAFLYAGLFIVASQFGRVALGHTDAWIAFARWLIGTGV